jgi:hypothetical protein
MPQCRVGRRSVHSAPSPGQRPNWAARDPATRIGVTVAPFISGGPATGVDLAVRAERLGYDAFWVAEVAGVEAFSVLSAAPRVAVGTGVLPTQVHTPPLLATSADTVQEVTPDREVLTGVSRTRVCACRPAHARRSVTFRCRRRRYSLQSVLTGSYGAESAESCA